MVDHRINGFLGTWVLDPSESQYDQGEPPLSGTYQISADGDLLTFTMCWTAADGSEETAEFSALPDGRNMPLRESGLVDAVCLYVDEDGALISEAKRGDQVLMSAKRVLTDAGAVLDIEQTVEVPGEGPVINSSIYRRQQ